MNGLRIMRNTKVPTKPEGFSKNGETGHTSKIEFITKCHRIDKGGVIYLEISYRRDLLINNKGCSMGIPIKAYRVKARCHDNWDSFASSESQSIEDSLTEALQYASDHNLPIESRWKDKIIPNYTKNFCDRINKEWEDYVVETNDYNELPF